MVEYSHDDAQRRLTCRFTGELRTNECLDLQEKVALRVSSFLEECKGGSSSAAPSIVFDVKDVTFASSFFVRISLSCIQRVGRENFAIANANDFITGLFRTVGMQDLLRG